LEGLEGFGELFVEGIHDFVCRFLRASLCSNFNVLNEVVDDAETPCGHGFFCCKFYLIEDCVGELENVLLRKFLGLTFDRFFASFLRPSTVELFLPPFLRGNQILSMNEIGILSDE
jgi:hypothetical protein